MSGHAEQKQSETQSGPSPLAGLLFLIFGVSGFFGLISVVDPLL